jgi:hypothetical protein
MNPLERLMEWVIVNPIAFVLYVYKLALVKSEQALFRRIYGAHIRFVGGNDGPQA